MLPIEGRDEFPSPPAEARGSDAKGQRLTGSESSNKAVRLSCTFVWRKR